MVTVKPEGGDARPHTRPPAMGLESRDKEDPGGSEDAAGGLWSQKPLYFPTVLSLNAYIPENCWYSTRMKTS